jgi:hypothetical protein
MTSTDTPVDKLVASYLRKRGLGEVAVEPANVKAA